MPSYLKAIHAKLEIQSWERWRPPELLPHYVYRLLTFTGSILYVGMTKNLLDRIKQHRENRLIPFAKFDFLQYEKRQDARKVEVELIRKWKPRFNKRGVQTLVVLRPDGREMTIRL